MIIHVYLNKTYIFQTILIRNESGYLYTLKIIHTYFFSQMCIVIDLRSYLTCKIKLYFWNVIFRSVLINVAWLNAFWMMLFFILYVALALFKTHNSANWNNKRVSYYGIYTNRWIISAILMFGTHTSLLDNQNSFLICVKFNLIEANYLSLKCSLANTSVLFVFVHKQYNILSSFYCLHESEKMITTKWNESSFATSNEKNRRYDT